MQLFFPLNFPRVDDYLLRNIYFVCFKKSGVEVSVNIWRSHLLNKNKPQCLWPKRITSSFWYDKRSIQFVEFIQLENKLVWYVANICSHFSPEFYYCVVLSRLHQLTRNKLQIYWINKQRSRETDEWLSFAWNLSAKLSKKCESHNQIDGFGCWPIYNM